MANWGALLVISRSFSESGTSLSCFQPPVEAFTLSVWMRMATSGPGDAVKKGNWGWETLLIGRLNPLWSPRCKERARWLRECTIHWRSHRKAACWSLEPTILDNSDSTTQSINSLPRFVQSSPLSLIHALAAERRVPAFFDTLPRQPTLSGRLG